ncbi:rho GTPase-activating protein 19-like [Genypterus blacodes]|uniref:rho GTPase-activating protein 19-like n=1 Tax=Genypterus blacodes TaxID=154954 RepID=UPI003F763E41
MATAGELPNIHKTNQSVITSQDEATTSPPVIFSPDFFVERLRHEHPQAFADLVLSHITRLIDLPGEEFAQLIGEAEPKLPTHTDFLRPFSFLKRKEKEGVVFGAPLTEEGIAQIYQLIEYLNKNLHVEGLFRVPGHSLRQAALKEMLNAGAEIDLEAGDFHPNDAATVLKAYLGELPEPLLMHRHYHAHLKIGELTRFDDKGNKTDVPDKERQIEALQLLFMLLPAANRSLLKLLLNLLYQTACKQHTNRMSAIALATMFAPHIIWPKNVMAADLRGDIDKLNTGIAFLIRHAPKLLTAPRCIKEYARLYYTGSRIVQSKDGLTPCTGTTNSSLVEVAGCSSSSSMKTVGEENGRSCTISRSETQRYTEAALKELFQHVNNMPDSAKKKKLIRQFEKQHSPMPSLESHTKFNGKHGRPGSVGRIIKRMGLQNHTLERKRKKFITEEDSSTLQNPVISGEKENDCFGGD